jgi:hypothetical protein
MKHISANIRNGILPILFIVLGSGISQTSVANNHLPARHGGNQDAVVRYVPGKGGDVLFNVLYSNASGNRFSVMILDEFGNQLYQEFFSDKDFNKTFKLADPEIASKLTFVIRNYGDNSVQRFEVNAVNHLVEEVEVKEVN